jgi:hypothetical protein
MSTASGLRLAAVLGFVAAGLALTAALISWSKDGKLEWGLFAGAAFMVALGWSSLRRSKSVGS